MHRCIVGIDFASCSANCLLEFGTVLTACFFFHFHTAHYSIINLQTVGSHY
jgi:hypothetical protein